MAPAMALTVVIKEVFRIFFDEDCYDHFLEHRHRVIRL